MYLDFKTIIEFEEQNGYETILSKNKEIASFLGFLPEIEWMVGDEEGSCYSPKNCGFHDRESQKQEVTRWLKVQKEKYPNSWVIKQGNQVIKREIFPEFHTDWNHLMEAIKRLQAVGIKIEIVCNNIFQTWFNVTENLN